MVKQILPPYSGPPVSRLISQSSVPSLPRYIKTGDTIGFDKTFKDGYWDDSLTWNDLNVWEE